MDLNQVMIATLMQQIGNHYNSELDEDMLRHMVINSIRANKKKFAQEYGNLIICCDDKNYWRRKVFPYYKARRKEDREKSTLDWNEIFQSLNKIREELKENMPYKVIQIDTAEADDIIGTICHKYGQVIGGEKILILSGDKDYIQLHVYGNVVQYDPSKKKWIKHGDPEDYLFEHIIRGDVGDGIPNILSPDNVLAMKIRQKPITTKRLEAWKKYGIDGTNKREFERNRILIDLANIPEDIQNQVLTEFDKPVRGREKLMNYFMKNKLKLLMENLSDF